MHHQNPSLYPEVQHCTRICLFFLVTYLTPVVFLFQNFLIVLKRLARKHCYSIKPMKVSNNAGTKQAIAAYSEMQFHNIQGCHRNLIKFQDFLGHFPALFKIFLQVIKFNFDYYSFMNLLFCTSDWQKILMQRICIPNTDQ